MYSLTGNHRYLWLFSMSKVMPNISSTRITPKQRLDVLFPKLEEDDIVMIGSYYALNPVLREKILELLDQAREKKAIIYYDPNFRSSHKNEAMKLAPTIIENLEYADIVRGSLEDFFLYVRHAGRGQDIQG